MKGDHLPPCARGRRQCGKQRASPFQPILLQRQTLALWESEEVVCWSPSEIKLTANVAIPLGNVPGGRNAVLASLQSSHIAIHAAN